MWTDKIVKCMSRLVMFAGSQGDRVVMVGEAGQDVNSGAIAEGTGG